MHKTYGQLAARVYQLDKPVGCSFGDVEFYLQRLKDIQGEVLEPAVGNGRMLVPLAKAGHQMTGFDLSEAMLNLCHQACTEHGVKADISLNSFTGFSYAQKFAAIVVPAGSFQLLTNVSDAMQFLQRCRLALDEGGKLLLDISLVNCFTDHAPRVRQWQDGADFLTLQEMRSATDYAQQIATAQLRYELWRDSDLIATQMELFSLRWWGKFELELALKAAGFTEIRIFADYKQDGLDIANARVLTFEAV